MVHGPRTSDFGLQTSLLAPFPQNSLYCKKKGSLRGNGTTSTIACHTKTLWDFIPGILNA